MCEKNRFEVLIEDIRVLIDDLIEMLPERAVVSQRRIATLEISEISDYADIELLKDMSCKDDPQSRIVVARVLETMWLLAKHEWRWVRSTARAAPMAACRYHLKCRKVTKQEITLQFIWEKSI